jgi:sigma-B regulation protein RsbU (phosphoserine phosphatase)
MRILIVDDSEDGRDVADAMLSSGGYENISAVASATDAYRFLEIGGPETDEPSPVDIILLDIMMPGIDGIEACARIRKEKRYSDVPIIMVTAVDDMNSLGNAFVAGATDYINKPLNRTEILARVRSALKLKSELDRRRSRESELLQFMSTWVDRRASQWIDNTTGLFVGEVAEAYLIATANFSPDYDVSVIALSVDRLDAYRSQGEDIAAGIMERVACAVRTTAATVGVVPAAYRSGMIVLVAPDMPAKHAQIIGEALRASVAKLGIANPEAIAEDHITASVSVVTGRPSGWVDRVDLLTRAISAVPRLAAAGGNRVVPEPAYA